LSTARIVKDQKLSADESLALLVVTSEGASQAYVAIVSHPNGGGISYRAAESVTPVNQDTVWLRRSILQGRNAETLAYPQNAATLSSKTVKLARAGDPVM
jgi:hypothetical protein